MDLRSNNPYWLLKNGIVATYPSVSKDLKTEVAIIGAGITGALIAWHLCRAGIGVVIIDKRHVGMGSTAGSTALLQYEVDTPLHKLCDMVGEARAVQEEAWDIFEMGGRRRDHAEMGILRSGRITFKNGSPGRSLPAHPSVAS